MEKKTKTGIEHLGSALALICRITRMVFVITGVVLLIGSVVSLSGSDLIRKVEWLYKKTFCIRFFCSLLELAAWRKNMQPRLDVL